MKITFIGAAHEVTGSCTLVEACGRVILVDCGMEQGADIYENCELPVAANLIDYVFVTHAHIDHTGKLPLLAKQGFRGKVFSTVATRDLCTIMLADSAHIQETEAESRNRRAKRSGAYEYTPLYDINDVHSIMKRFDPYDYGKKVYVDEGITAEFFDAGHLLGSSSIRLTLTEGDVTKAIVFSGDIGSTARPLLSDPVTPDSADILVIESTYGDRVRETVPAGYEANLAKLIDSTISRGGNLVIPSFAIGRTQELLYMIRNIKEKRLTVSDFPVYIDSPLAIEATNIYSGTLDNYYDSEAKELLARGVNPIGFKKLVTAVSADDSKRINTDPTPKVIISASGMCEAGRIRHHLKYNLWRPESTILFVGYQVPGTLGRRLLDGAKYISIFGEDIRVEARIERLEGFSGHADHNMLLDWLEGFEKMPSTVYVNHGEDATTDTFAKDITDTFSVKATAPYSGDVYDLVSGELIEGGFRKRITRTRSKNKSSEQASRAWNRLYSAGLRLMSLIERSRGIKEKEKNAFADRINTLCDKQEKLNHKNKKK